MALNLANKPRPSIVRAMRALVPPLLEKWGDAEGFRAVAAPIALREGGAALSSLNEAEALADQVYRAVVRLRALHFRPIENPQSLDTVFKGLEVAASAPNVNPLIGGGLWLAYRVQGAAIQYLGSPDGKTAVANAEAALAAAPTAWLRQLGAEGQAVTLEHIEAALAERIARDSAPGVLRFNLYAVAGHLLEQGRIAARQAPQLKLPDAAPREPTASERLAEALSEPVRDAELAEARARFSKLTMDQTTQRFNEFKLQLLRMVTEVAPHAPAGLDSFCQAIEAQLYPYPAQLEWIRPFVKPVWTNASQSTLFGGANSPELVDRRYEQLRKTKQGNPIVVELARAFALAMTQKTMQDQEATSLKDLNLVEEFHWPASLEDMKAQWAKGHASER